MGQEVIKKISSVFSLIKFSHSIFALPFALSAMLVAAHGFPSLKVICLIIACMVSGRTAAMSFNRYLDAEIDAKNPRTASREIPQGIISSRFALTLSIVSSIFLVLFSALINRLCLFLSPIALFFIYFYSFTKRFTSISHLFLGLVLGITPTAAWIAVTGEFAKPPILLGIGVLFWVAGFDIIYATQDHEFDLKAGLHSLVVQLGIRRALWVSRLFHLLTLLCFLYFGILIGGGLAYWLAITIAAALLVSEHRLVRADDLSHVNAAFFNMNGYLSLVFLAGVILTVVK